MIASSHGTPPLLMLGLPYLANNELLAAARRLGATVLVSANAFSRWDRRGSGAAWQGSNLQPLRHAIGLPIALDSAGFVAAVKYRRFPWQVDDYLDLCTASPWLWFSSMDFCTEPEIAGDEETVLHRISGTVRLTAAPSVAEARRNGKKKKKSREGRTTRALAGKGKASAQERALASRRPARTRGRRFEK
jgi:hypothetical protein